MSWKLDIKPFDFNNLKHGFLEKKFNVDEKAKSDALAGVPGETATQRTAVEIEGIAEARNHLDNEKERAADWTSELSVSITNLRIKLNQNPLSNIGNKFRTSLNTLFAGIEENINRKKGDISDAKEKLRVFKMEHSIVRDPVVKPQWVKLITFAIPVLFIIFETIYNGSVFQDVLQGGETAGRAMALGLSLINVLTSFFIGVMLPWLWYKEISYRIWGSIFVLIWLSVITYINFFFGVFRSKLDSGDGNNFSGGFEESSIQMADATNIVGNPFTQLDQLTADGTQFIFVCFIFAICSLLDGLFKNDTYRGYGAVGEKVSKAQDKLEQLRLSLVSDLKNEKDSFDSEVITQSEEINRNIEIWRSGIEELQNFSIKYNTFIKNLSEDLSHYLDQYIAVNRQYRPQDQNEPAYWPQSGQETPSPINVDENNFHISFPQLKGEFLDDTEANDLKNTFISALVNYKEEAESEIQKIYDEYASRRDNLL